MAEKLAGDGDGDVDVDTTADFLVTLLLNGLRPR